MTSIKFRYGKCFILMCLGVVLGSKTNAQTIEIDSKIKSLIKMSNDINEQNKSMSGFRIQIFSGSKRDKATELKTTFEQLFGSIPVYLIYQQPNFKVRAGDFKTRIEAASLLEKIKSDFDIAFIVKDEVSLPKE
jgi:hypothetical protein